MRDGSWLDLAPYKTGDAVPYHKVKPTAQQKIQHLKRMCDSIQESVKNLEFEIDRLIIEEV